MSVNADHDYLDLLIANQHRAIRFYYTFAAMLIAFGAAIIVFSFAYAGQFIPDNLKSIVGIGGGFVSSLSAFSVKEVLNRKDKAETFKTIKAKRPLLESAKDEASRAERERIDAAIWQAIEKTIVG